MASTGNRHCANHIGALYFPIIASQKSASFLRASDRIHMQAHTVGPT